MTIKTYIVGGAVRDTLLGRSVKDIDYVVVGSTPTMMTNLGFKQVGADFPVFLHRSTNEEYALARTERKVGDGYYGFTTDYNPNVTLEEDLERRDLTINAMAVSLKDWDEFRKTKESSLVIDPFNGQSDLKNRVLRHVSEAFAEDPVRVLRIARLKARYNLEYGFTIATKTSLLIKQMVSNGEVDNLVTERVWTETEKALMEDSPSTYFETLLLEADVLEHVLPLFSGNEDDDTVNQALWAAALRDLGLEHRMMILTSSLFHYTLMDDLKKMKVPSNIAKSCVEFNGLIAFMRSFTKDDTYDKIDAVDIFMIINGLDGWKREKELRNMGITLAMFNDPRMNTLFSIIMQGLAFANTAKFSDLTTEQQSTLQGSQIAQAISKRRLDLLDDAIF